MSNYIRLIAGTLVDASFGGTDLSDYKFYCYDFVKGLMPRQREVTIDIPDTPGISQLKKKFISRPIKLYGYMDCSSHADLISKINDLAGFLYSDEDQRLILSNETDRYYNAQYIDYAEIWRRKDYAKLILVFNCNDPFAYNITADDSDETGIIVKDTTWNITNNGKYYAYPVITITMNQNQEHLYIKNTNFTSNRFDITKSMASGKELEIDSKNMIIKYDGSFSPAGFGDGGTGKADFIILQTGVNVLQIGTDDDDINFKVNVSFRKVYF